MDESSAEGMSDLLARACGSRSITEFANSCGISRAHLFRMRKGVTPSRKLCKRISEDKYVQQLGITCEYIYKVAGYTSSEDLKDAQQHEEQIVSKSGVDTIDLGIVTKILMKSNLSHQLLPVDQNQDVDFAFEVKKGRNRKKWKFIVLHDSLSDTYSRRQVNAFYYNYGRILSLVPSVQEQYTLILHNENAYEKLLSSINRNSLTGHISVVLVDFDLMVISKEADLGPDRLYFTLSEYN